MTAEEIVILSTAVHDLQQEIATLRAAIPAMIDAAFRDQAMVIKVRRYDAIVSIGGRITVAVLTSMELIVTGALMSRWLWT